MDTTNGKRIQIIGGGVAGLALGVGLQSRGIPTTVFDKGAYPRHRVCGEFVCGVRAVTLDKLGLNQLFKNALRHSSTVWTLGGKEVLRAELPFEALGISRYSMDLLMAEEFTRMGGELKPKTAFEPEERDKTEGIIWATGRKRERGPWLGLKLHCKNYELLGDLEVHLGKQAYVGASAVEGGCVNVCGLFRKVPGIRGRGEEVLFRYLESADLDHLKEKILMSDPDLDSYCGVSHFTFARPIDFWRSRSNSSSFALGDQLGVIPPFTGNGMSIALETAALALDPVEQFAAGKLSWNQAKELFRKAARRHLDTRFRVANSIQPLLLNSKSQRWVAGLARNKLLPFGPLFALTHGS